MPVNEYSAVAIGAAENIIALGTSWSVGVGGFSVIHCFSPSGDVLSRQALRFGQYKATSVEVRATAALPDSVVVDAQLRIIGGLFSRPVVVQVDTIDNSGALPVLTVSLVDAGVYYVQTPVASSKVTIYDPDSGTWDLTNSLAAALPNVEATVTWGSSNEVYDEGSSTWSLGTPDVYLSVGPCGHDLQGPNLTFGFTANIGSLSVAGYPPFYHNITGLGGRVVLNTGSAIPTLVEAQLIASEDQQFQGLEVGDVRGNLATVRDADLSPSLVRLDYAAHGATQLSSPAGLVVGYEMSVLTQEAWSLVIGDTNTAYLDFSTDALASVTKTFKLTLGGQDSVPQALKVSADGKRILVVARDAGDSAPADNLRLYHFTRTGTGPSTDLTCDWTMLSRMGDYNALAFYGTGVLFATTVSKTAGVDQSLKGLRLVKINDQGELEWNRDVYHDLSMGNSLTPYVASNDARLDSSQWLAASSVNGIYISVKGQLPSTGLGFGPEPSFGALYRIPDNNEIVDSSVLDISPSVVSTSVTTGTPAGIEVLATPTVYLTRAFPLLVDAFSPTLAAESLIDLQRKTFGPLPDPYVMSTDEVQTRFSSLTSKGELVLNKSVGTAGQVAVSAGAGAPANWRDLGTTVLLKPTEYNPNFFLTFDSSGNLVPTTYNGSSFVSLSDNVVIPKNLRVNEELTVTKKATVYQGMAVYDGLTVFGDATFSGGMTLNGTMVAQGNVQAKGSLIGNQLQVTQNITANHIDTTSGNIANLSTNATLTIPRQTVAALNLKVVDTLPDLGRVAYATDANAGVGTLVRANGTDWIDLNTGLPVSTAASTPYAYVLPAASSTVLGGVKQGTGVTIAGDGTLSVTAVGGVSSVAGRTGAVTLSVSDVSGAVASSLLGAANGVATLGADQKVPVSQLPDSVLGGLGYLGVWNAATNTPALTSGVGVAGRYYKVSVAGTTALDGNDKWTVGDLVLFNGTTWDQIQGGTSDVSSVFGRVGAVTLTSADVTTALGFTPYSATNPNGYQTAAQVTAAITGSAYSLPTASTTTLGGVKVDGTTITITNGVIAAAGGSSFSSVDDNATAATYYPLMATTAGGSVAKTSSTKLTFNPSTGDFYAYNVVTASDARLKEEVRPICNALDTVSQIEGVSFRMRDTGQRSYGVIAQQLQSVLPEIVRGSPEDGGQLSVCYDALVGILLTAVQELRTEVEFLKTHL